MSIALHRLLAATTSTDVAALLEENVVFHSPVADYRGRADVAHLLAAIASCLSDPQTEEELRGAESTATTFVSAVGERRLDGVLVQRYSERGLLAEATLLLRPLSVLKVAVSGMRDALAADPLPSAR